MANFDDGDGVWRTIQGRRVFIREGQSLGDAMKASGKFKNLKSKGGKVQSKKELFKERLKDITADKEKTLSRTEKNKGLYEKLNKENEGIQLSQKQIEAGNKLNANAEKGVRDDIKAFLSGKENYDGSQADFEKDLSNEWGVDKSKVEDILHEEMLKHPRNFKNDSQSKKEVEQTMSSKKTMTEEEFGKRIKEIQSTPSYKEKMDEAVEELNKKYGYSSKTDKATNEDSKSETFIQNTNMYGGTREYNKEQLDRMKENGMKPMKDSYTGGGWEGTKYDSKLSTKEIAKNITDYSKKEFPDVKLSRKTDYNGVDIHVMSSDKDLYLRSNDIDKMSDNQLSSTIRDSIGGYTRFDDWLNKNNKKSDKGTYTANEQREYLKSQLSSYKDRKGDTVSGNEWYLSDYGKKVISGLNKEMNSYNYDDSDGMVDYFNTNFYGYVHIGKWDKPYETKQTTSTSQYMNNQLRQKAFQKYMKEHPASKMSFEDFKKMESK